MVRFVATADWQLGMTRHFLGPDAQARFTAARIDAIDRIGALAVQHDAPLVLVAGDVFESNQVPRQTVVRALEAMGAHPSVTFLLLPGNHDPLDASSIFRSVTFVERCPRNVMVVDGSAAVPVAPGVHVVGAPWPSKKPLSDLVADAVAPLRSDSTLRIVMGHGAVDVLNPERTDPAMIELATLDAALDAGTIHAVVLGDRHSTTALGFEGRVVYPGSPEGTDFVETDAGNVLVCELSSTSFTAESHRVGTWTFVRRLIDLANRDDVETLGGWLDGLCDPARTIVRLGLTGQLSLSEHARLAQILDFHGERLGALDRWDAEWRLVTRADELDLDRLALSGWANEALVELRGDSDSGDRTAGDALALLYRLAVTS